MKTIMLISLAMLAAPAAVQAEDLEPAVNTSSAPQTPAATGKPKRSGALAGKAQDRIELDTTQITGNRELPRVMYVVPWKKPNLGEFAGRPPNSLLDELLTPVDREVFRRQNRYFAALQPDATAAVAAATAATPDATAVPPSAVAARPGAAVAAPGAAAARPATAGAPAPSTGDEK
jgi:hypothetical protein